MEEELAVRPAPAVRVSSTRSVPERRVDHWQRVWAAAWWGRRRSGRRRGRRVRVRGGAMGAACWRWCVGGGVLVLVVVLAVMVLAVIVLGWVVLAPLIHRSVMPRVVALAVRSDVQFGLVLWRATSRSGRTDSAGLTGV